jgi:hypothetical protein
MRRIFTVLAVAALVAAMVVASAAPAFAQGKHDDNGKDNGDRHANACCGFDHRLNSPIAVDVFDDFGDHNDNERQDATVFCPVVGVIVDNGSAFNNTCAPLIVG